MPAFRTTTARRALAAGLTATAALVLVAGCRGTGGARPDDPATAVSPAPASPAPTDGGGPPRARGGRVACTAEMLRFHAGALPHRAHRMLLTVTNYSDRTCDFAAPRHPLLRFGEGRQPAVPAIGASQERSVLRLAPNATAYATIITRAPGGSTGKGRPVSQFGVALAEHAAPVQVGLDDRAPVRVDPHGARVTYWLPSLLAARMW
ncbi:DUF4232 domain-containing protein [Streptomyces sp. NPDC048506]|uniref:DUF4232 domain-containing protein n=1 Tax=Streptomyces sp. NPDC048506 TaxID=3155028 RepID=UPI00343F4EC6